MVVAVMRACEGKQGMPNFAYVDGVGWVNLSHHDVMWVGNLPGSLTLGDIAKGNIDERLHAWRGPLRIGDVVRFGRGSKLRGASFYVCEDGPKTMYKFRLMRKGFPNGNGTAKADMGAFWEGQANKGLMSRPMHVWEYKNGDIVVSYLELKVRDV